MRDAIEAGGDECELIVVRTDGDVSQASLAQIGGTGVFAGALRRSLLAGECDLVVHSLKDLPVLPAPGLVVAGVPAREDARDALCARDGLTLDTLPAGATVGTGSPRRRAQLLERRPDLDVRDLRGNVDTRLGHVTDGRLDAVVLSLAGLTRLGRPTRSPRCCRSTQWPTAAGQGALALEIRESDAATLADRVALRRGRRRAPAHGSARRGRRRPPSAACSGRLEAGCVAPIGVASAVADGVGGPVGERARAGRRTAPRPPDRGDHDRCGRGRGARRCRAPARGRAARRGRRRARAAGRCRMTTAKPLRGWTRARAAGRPVGRRHRRGAARPRGLPRRRALDQLRRHRRTRAGARPPRLARLEAGAFDWMSVTSATTVDVLSAHGVRDPRADPGRGRRRDDRRRAHGRRLPGRLHAAPRQLRGRPARGVGRRDRRRRAPAHPRAPQRHREARADRRPARRRARRRRRSSPTAPWASRSRPRSSRTSAAGRFDAILITSGSVANQIAAADRPRAVAHRDRLHRPAHRRRRGGGGAARRPRREGAQQRVPDRHARGARRPPAGPTRTTPRSRDHSHDLVDRPPAPPPAERRRAPPVAETRLDPAQLVLPMFVQGGHRPSRARSTRCRASLHHIARQPPRAPPSRPRRPASAG